MACFASTLAPLNFCTSTIPRRTAEQRNVGFTKWIISIRLGYDRFVFQKQPAVTSANLLHGTSDNTFLITISF